MVVPSPGAMAVPSPGAMAVPSLGANPGLLTSVVLLFLCVDCPIMFVQGGVLSRTFILD